MDYSGSGYGRVRNSLEVKECDRPDFATNRDQDPIDWNALRMQLRTFLLVTLGTAVLGVGGLASLLVGFIEFCRLADAGNFPRGVAYLLTMLLAAALGFAGHVFPHG